MMEKLTNQKAEDVVKGWSAFFNKDLSKEILMFINSRDSFAIAHKLLNQSLNTEDFEQIKKSKEYTSLNERLLFYFRRFFGIF